MKRLFVGLVVASGLLAQDRPRVPGVAHTALYATDLARARQFYEDFLGFGEPFTVSKREGRGTHIAVVKINDYQYFELFNEKDRGEGRLNHISFYTDSTDRMYAYLKLRGVEVMSADDNADDGPAGNKHFNVKDPDGHVVEIIEYRPKSWTARRSGKFLPDTRISDHLAHVGVLVSDLDRSMAFYQGVFGFQEFWRGSNSPQVLSWVNMRVPDGQDYIEFMLYNKIPEPDGRGTKNHASLWISDGDNTLAELTRRGAKIGYDHEIKIQTGVNRKRQINLYDPDGARELMERNTVDGKPAPSSTAPPPRPRVN